MQDFSSIVDLRIRAPEIGDLPVLQLVGLPYQGEQ